MDKSISWQSYPRPQLKRDSYYNLNGVWKLNGEDILVPYPPESVLSEYKGKLCEEMIYERTFFIPEDFHKERIILHFGAVDQTASVWINGSFVGRNEGGYLPFSFDVTESVKRGKENVLKVVAVDKLDKSYPYGKQTKKPGGMWYTPVSGIWQTVWLENVSKNYIKDIKIDTDLEKVCIKLNGNVPIDAFSVSIENVNGWRTEEFVGDECEMTIEEPVQWTCDNPHLYNIKIKFGEDEVESYFALRTIKIKEIDGVKRVCLNDKPVFFHGVLDQGYFHDGIFLPKDEAEYENDIRRMKELGFNMLRKHIKIEPEYFYYACDRIGMLVMQDMVNTGKYSFIKDTALPTIGFKNKNDRVKKLTKSMLNFQEYTMCTLKHLYNHPCIVSYTIFNEGWGQFDSDLMYKYVKGYDSSRLVDSTSGWYAQKENDFDSRHIYFKTIDLKVKDKPLFVTECGGYKMMVKDHFKGRKEYGYGTCADMKVLSEQIKEIYEKMIIPGIKKGVCGCIYTQLSDVEDEINGLYTYDREVCKVDKEVMKSIVVGINKNM